MVDSRRDAGQWEADGGAGAHHRQRMTHSRPAVTAGAVDACIWARGHSSLGSLRRRLCGRPARGTSELEEEGVLPAGARPRRRRPRPAGAGFVGEGSGSRSHPVRTRSRAGLGPGPRVVRGEGVG
jgi:hypothetical protein